MILKFPFRSSFHVEIANAIQEEHHIRVESVDYDIFNAITSCMVSI